MRGRGALDLSIGYAESCRMTLITAATTLALTMESLAALFCISVLF
jgi:hypothetical protein